MWFAIFVLHLLSAVLWVGGMFFALVVLRPSMAVLQPADRMALHSQVFKKFFLVVWHAMPVALVTGYALLFGVYGGFRGAHWSIHVMHLLGVVMGAIYLALFFGPYAAFRKAPGPGSLARVRQLITLNLALGLLTVAIAGAGRYGL